MAWQDKDKKETIDFGDKFDLEVAGLTVESEAPFLTREPWAARFAAGIGRHHALLMTLCALLLWIITSFPALNLTGAYRPGDIAAKDIVASHTSLISDREETESRRHDAAALVPPVYRGNPDAQSRAFIKFHRELKQAPHSNYSSNERLRIARAGEEAIRAVYRGGQIRSDVTGDITLAHNRIAASLRDSAQQMTLTAREYAAARALSQKVAQVPNLVVDQAATRRARRDAQNDVREVFNRVKAGDVLVNAGETLTAEKWNTLAALGMVAPRFDIANTIALLALCGVMVMMAGGYVATLNRSLLDRPAALWLTAMTPIFFLALFRFLLRVPYADFLLIPLTACATILLTILLGVRPSLLVAVLIGALGTLMIKGNVGLCLTAVLVAWSGAFSTANIVSRGQLVRASLLVGMTSGVLMGALGLLQETPLDQLPPLLLWSTLAGAFTVLLAAGLAMLLERPFGITTHLRLMELLAPDEDLLRRLQTEAPGTYAHSLMVSLMGEAAAKAVGADSLLCRTGGLYHDIGKLRYPHCFVENQSGDNIHDRLEPIVSARLIVGHVTDGLALGRALKLPRPILDIIATHHGTSRVEYFYHQAIAQYEILDKNFSSTSLAIARINEEDFRYPGPTPQTKEAAIMMLADAVEASSRALANATPERLEQHVKAVIDGRLRDGELAACDLTLRDLGKIETAFLHFLKGVMHQRIEYPGASKDSAVPTSGDESEKNSHDVLRMHNPLTESFLQDEAQKPATLAGSK